MMAQCPNCSANVSDDFGLTECGSCHAQLLVHIDGTVEFSGAGSDDVPPRESAYEEPTPDEPVYEASAFKESAAEEPAYEEPAYEEPVYEEAAYEEPVPDDAPSEETATEPEASAEPAPPEPEPEYNFDEPEPFAEPTPVAPVGNDSPDLSDIAAFGNSAASGGRDGALRYNVRVTGVDTADVREAFREALTDRKFVWDTDEILRSIKDGACEIGDVSSVKAHILITRLRQLPVEVEWEQYAITQT